MALRTIQPEGKWRYVCGCCAEFVYLFLALSGKVVEVKRAEDVDANAITYADMEAAHDALKGDVRVADLFK